MNSYSGSPGGPISLGSRHHRRGFAEHDHVGFERTQSPRPSLTFGREVRRIHRDARAMRRGPAPTLDTGDRQTRRQGLPAVTGLPRHFPDAPNQGPEATSRARRYSWAGGVGR
jgi:hypothetical protein